MTGLFLCFCLQITQKSHEVKDRHKSHMKPKTNYGQATQGNKWQACPVLFQAIHGYTVTTRVG